MAALFVGSAAFGYSAAATVYHGLRSRRSSTEIEPSPRVNSRVAGLLEAAVHVAVVVIAVASLVNGQVAAGAVLLAIVLFNAGFNIVRHQRDANRKR